MRRGGGSGMKGGGVSRGAAVGGPWGWSAADVRTRDDWRSELGTEAQKRVYTVCRSHEDA